MSRFQAISRRSVSVGAVAALAGLSMLVPTASGQTPEATEAPHPVHIHAGTCAELGDVVFPLTDLAPAKGEHVGAASAVELDVSQTTIDLPLEEIINGGHAINVHLSADEIGTYIACGDIGGVVVTDEGGRTELMVGLREVNGSGYSGMAWLGKSKDGTQTEVAVLLLDPEDQGAE